MYVGVCRVGETLIVNHHVKPVGPFGILVEVDLRRCSLAAVVDDRPDRGDAAML